MRSNKYRRLTFIKLCELGFSFLEGYATEKTEAALLSFYEAVYEICIRIVIVRYRRRYQKLFEDEFVSDLTSDIVFYLHRNPEKIESPGKLKSYIGESVKRRYATTLQQKVFYKKNYICLYDKRMGMPADIPLTHGSSIPLPDANLYKLDRIKIIVHTVARELSKTIRFQDTGHLLLWPMVACILTDSDGLFDGFPYQDRVSLKAMLARCSTKVNRSLSEHAYD